MAVTVRHLQTVVEFAGELLEDVIAVRGEVTADGGWPTCSVFVTAKPATGNQEDTIEVTAGAGNNELRFTGRVRRFRPSSFPKSIEMVATGTLAYAAEWAPEEDFTFEWEFVDGATDQTIVQWVLDHVPGVTYDAADIGGTGIVLGDPSNAPEAFDWKAGTSAWSYIQQLDKATLYRTYQTRDGTIRRVRMIGHPDNVPDFTLAPADILDGASGSRDTERTRNFVRVIGYDYGEGHGPTFGEAAGSNDFQGDGSNSDFRHVEVFQSPMIENGIDDEELEVTVGGLDARDIAAAVLPDVNKEFVEAQVPSWRDDTHGPGMTCLLDALDRLAIGEPMWVVRHAWEVGDNGWQATYGLTGGGLPQVNPAPPV